MSYSSTFRISERPPTLSEKIGLLNYGLIFLLTLVACTGFIALYSAGGGSVDPWAGKHLLRYAVCLIIAIVIALVDIRIWMRSAYLAYGAAFFLLLLVEIMGEMGMGAQRWINLGVIKLQPSEIMKIGVIMALARYFHGSGLEEMGRIRHLIIPVLLIMAPVCLVLIQPDLGTALMIVMSGVAMLFFAGARWWKFALGGAGVLAMIPVAWQLMHDYQKQRVMTFLDPESDPLGSGYHIMQSKIALGSGGIEGKGFLKGTQSHLNFLPEKQTDFVFTLLAEEWGLTGGIILLIIFALIFIYGIAIGTRARHNFGRLLACGLIVNFSLYIFINIAMVMGLMPVVGVPLPLVSYGGTAMLAAMISFGLIMNVYIHKDLKIARYL